ncbi:hypothetical protein AVEN_251012-1, partial [Araneus ventricosus]
VTHAQESNKKRTAHPKQYLVTAHEIAPRRIGEKQAGTVNSRFTKLSKDGWFGVLGVMIGEDLRKFSGSRVMRTIAIGRLPIRNLPIKGGKEKNRFFE